MEFPAAHSRQIVVIAGPTGSGESTITNTIIKRFPKRFCRLVTATTRTPRAGEVNGVDYYFFTKEDFLKKESAGELLETTHIKNRDTYYGTYLHDLTSKLDSSFVVIVNADIVGAKFYKEKYGATTIFIVPGNIDELPTRLRVRNPEMSETEIQNRYHNAAEEIREEGPFYDYQVTNSDGKLDDAVAAIISILEKEGYDFNSR